MWIKICGITSVEDAKLAIAAGADAVGFVFAESPRRITREAARDISRAIPTSAERIGVFVDATPDAMAESYKIAGLTGVQLHGSATSDFAGGFCNRIGVDRAKVRVVQVVHNDGQSNRFVDDMRKLSSKSSGENLLDAVLVDTCVAGKQGGTGRVFDWQAARETFFREAGHVRLIAAGGLRPENVREAIQTLRPWGVDVSSGVEFAPGRKDPQRVAEFIRAARAAEAEFGIGAQ